MPTTLRNLDGCGTSSTSLELTDRTVFAVATPIAHISVISCLARVECAMALVVSASALATVTLAAGNVSGRIRYTSGIETK